jgi:hypothetical protein
MSTVREVLDLIERIELMKSFLSPTEQKKVKKTYSTHPFVKVEKNPEMKKWLNPVYRNSDYCYIENPKGSNFALGIKDLQLILKNYLIAFSRKHFKGRHN